MFLTLVEDVAVILAPYLMALAITANAALDSDHTYCFDPVAPNSAGRMQAVEDIRVEIPNEAELSTLPALRDRSVIPAPEGGVYIRAGIVAEPGLDRDAAYRRARDVTFRLYENPDNGDLLIFGLSFVPGPRQNYDLVLRAISPRPINRSFVGCYAVD